MTTPQGPDGTGRPEINPRPGQRPRGVSGAPYPAGRSGTGGTTGARDEFINSEMTTSARLANTPGGNEKQSSRESKIVAIILGIGVAVAFVVVIAMATNLIAPPNDEIQGIPTGAPTIGPTGGSGGENNTTTSCVLKTATYVKPVNWVAAAADGGCSLGPAGAETRVHLIENFNGDLQSLRPKCEGAPGGNPTPSATATDPFPAQQPTSPTPTGSAPIGATPIGSATPDGGDSDATAGTVTGVMRDVVRQVSGETAQSEAGTLECGDTTPRNFTSVLVKSKKFAITYDEGDLDVTYLLDSLVLA